MLVVCCCLLLVVVVFVASCWCRCLLLVVVCCFKCLRLFVALFGAGCCLCATCCVKIVVYGGLFVVCGLIRVCKFLSYDVLAFVVRCLVLCVVCGLLCDGSCFFGVRCCVLFGVKCLSFACAVVCRVLLVV